MKQIIDFISNIVPITGNSVADTILFFVIGAIAFAVAWWITGAVASGVDYDSESMSGIHWIVRIVIFLGLLGLCIGIVHLIRWFLSFEWWVYMILGISAALITGGIIFLKLYIKKKKKPKASIEAE